MSYSGKSLRIKIQPRKKENRIKIRTQTDYADSHIVSMSKNNCGRIHLLQEKLNAINKRYQSEVEEYNEDRHAKHL